MKNLKFLGLALLSMLLIILARPSSELRVVFCDVGQGDAILVVLKETQVLIDGGANNGKVLSCLERHLPYWDKNIELVIATHPDTDHIGGLVGVLESYEVQRFVYSQFSENKSSSEIQSLILSNNVQVWEASDGNEIRLGDLVFEVLWPVREESGKILGATSDTNFGSVVLQLRYGEFDVLLTGDADHKVEEMLIDKCQNKSCLKDVEVLKAGHHGSKHSSATEFLEVIKPKLTVIQVGENSYGHPNQEVLERLEANQLKYLRNDLNGEIVINSNGKTWSVKSL